MTMTVLATKMPDDQAGAAASRVTMTTGSATSRMSKQKA